LKQSEQSIPYIMLEKFPEMADLLLKMYREDEDFKEICEDYVLCLNSMGKIIVTNKMGKRIIREYRKALNELEIEVLEYLNKRVNNI